MNEYLREKWHILFFLRNITFMEDKLRHMQLGTPKKKAQTNVMHRVFTLNFFLFFPATLVIAICSTSIFSTEEKKKRLNRICALASLRCSLSGVRMIIIRIKITFK